MKSNAKAYLKFLASKTAVAIERGAEFAHSDLNPALKPHQGDLALWAVRGGNRAIFSSFGTGKTLIQIQILYLILSRTVFDIGRALIVCPLGVKGEFHRDALKFFGIEMQYVRTNEELAELTAAGHRYFVTNYERVRDGNLDPNLFDVVSLDEASVLRSYGSKTYQTFLTLFDKVPFKFVCTATPSPNRFKELIHYAAFLGVMDSGQALTRWFKRDSQSAGNLTIHPHKEREFWLWVSTWATFLTKPSDLGYDDTGYDLPPVKIIRHRLPVDHSTAGFDSWGQGKLVRDAAASLSAAAREKRDSQTYRLGWSENAKDGTKMGVGSPEYILLFRKLPSDLGNAYADEPVAKSKDAYTRSRWQFDASPFWRSSGDRFLTPEQMREIPSQSLREAWHAWDKQHIYDFKGHVQIAETLEASGLLPASFMLLDPQSHSEWVWDDVVRMRTLNTEQARKRVEGHICPLQFDVVDRLIERFSNPGELVVDPFGGLMTVPFRAIMKGRKGFGIELNSEYWADGVGYCRHAEYKITAPTLFDLTGDAPGQEVVPCEQ